MELWYAATTGGQKCEDKWNELKNQHMRSTSKAKDEAADCLRRVIDALQKAQHDLTPPWKTAQEYTSKNKARLVWDAILRATHLPSRQEAHDDYQKKQACAPKQTHDWTANKRQKGNQPQYWHKRQYKSQEWKGHNDWAHSSWGNSADHDEGERKRKNVEETKAHDEWEPYDWSEQMKKHMEEDHQGDEAPSARGSQHEQGSQSSWEKHRDAHDDEEHDDDKWGSWAPASHGQEKASVPPDQPPTCPPSSKRCWQKFGLLERMERKAKCLKLSHGAPWEHDKEAEQAELVPSDPVWPPEPPLPAVRQQPIQQQHQQQRFVATVSAQQVSTSVDITPPPPPAEKRMPPPDQTAPWRNRRSSQTHVVERDCQTATVAAPRPPAAVSRIPAPPMSYPSADGTFKRVPKPPEK
eukprot:6476803-Amphidinium_carterae.2